VTPKILDMDFFPTETGEQDRSRASTRKVHVFGQSESRRGIAPADGEADEKDQGFERARRRAAGLPIIHKYTSHLFPFQHTTFIIRDIIYLLVLVSLLTWCCQNKNIPAIPSPGQFSKHICSN
jgi:hypothetical protein